MLDGHGSHITIDVIEHGQANEIHMLCLPSHMSHILQPLDVGVFKSFKSFFSKVCRQHMAKNPGCVITEDILASVVGDAFAQSHTPLNILGGFKKAGIYPFNPGEVSDRQLAPSKAQKKHTSPTQTFSDEQVKLFEQRYAEGYDLPDPAYLAWKGANHPSSDSVSPPGSVAGTMSTANAATTSTTSSITSPLSVVTTSSNKSSEEVLDELLALPRPPPARTSQRKKAINATAKEITDPDVLQEMKDKELAEAVAKKRREENKLERERKAKERMEEKERKKLEREKKALERAKEKERKSREKRLKKPKNLNLLGAQQALLLASALFSLNLILKKMKGNVLVVECLSKMSKAMRGSGFAVTSAMGGIALLATTFPPKTLFPMSTIA